VTLNSSGVVTGGTEDASTMKISTKPLSSKLAPVRSPSSLSSAAKRDSFSTSAGSSGSGALKRQSSKDSVTGGDSSSGGAQQPDAKRTKRDSTDSTSSSSTTVIAPKPTLKVKHIIMHSVLVPSIYLLAMQLLCNSIATCNHIGQMLRNCSAAHAVYLLQHSCT
jgi:hypothetical protein